jgi:hypothetical protein
MTEQELKELVDTVELKKLSFNGDEFELEFANGVSVTVGKTTEWEYAVWEFESSIEKEKKRIEWHKRAAVEKEKKKQVEEKQNEILSKFPKEQWDEIRKTFRM